MACDVKKLMDNLFNVYNFEGKELIWVGAGVGQIAPYLQSAGRVLDVDNDPTTLAKFSENVAKLKRAEIFEAVLCDFYELEIHGDVVLFDFSLHEMEDPARAIVKARTLAPDVVVFDHWPGSEWAFLAAEEEKVKKSWAAIDAAAPKKKRQYMAEQFFDTYIDLQKKLEPQGAVSRQRILRHFGRTGIIIPMAYGIAVL